MTAAIATYLVLLQVGTAPSQQPPAKASVEGIVLRAGAGQPVPAARLTLLKQEGTKENTALTSAERWEASATDADSSSIVAVSDHDGRFLFNDLDRGPYRLVIQANGYVGQLYGRESGSAGGTPIQLSAGQKLKDLNIQLLPAGNISGHVWDRAKQPLAGVLVQLVRYSYNATGQREYQTGAEGKTNDRGEYRLYWITPGCYYLLAGTPAPAGSSAQGQDVKALQTAYYPGVADAATATIIEIGPAAELTGIDLTLATQPLHRVRGRVIDSQTGQPPSRADIEAFLQSSVVDPVADRESAKEGKYDATTGMFEISGLAPGRYHITAILQDGMGTRLISAGPDKGGYRPFYAWHGDPSPVGSIAVDVSGADVDGLALGVFPAVSIRGRFRTEGPADGIALDDFRIVLTPAAPRPYPLTLFMPIDESTIAARTESTWKEPLPPGDYRVAAEGLTGNAYIKDASLDGVDILNKPLRLSAAPNVLLEVVVSFNGGQISGIVTGDRQEPVPAAQVVLVPDRRRERVDLYKTARADASGRFTITGISPGDYRMFSWQSIEPYGWFDPQTLAQAGAKARPVQVLELSRQNVDVQIIPSGGGR